MFAYDDFQDILTEYVFLLIKVDQIFSSLEYKEHGSVEVFRHILWLQRCNSVMT
jgi:hypothetical protein